jgi:hypothetical protein
LKKSAGVAAIIRSVQADMQDDLAARHARRLSAGEDEIENLLEIVLRQTARVRCVPVVDLARTVRQRLQLRHRFRAPCGEIVRQSLKVMLKDPVDRVNMVEDAEHEEHVLLAQPVEVRPTAS